VSATTQALQQDCAEKTLQTAAMKLLRRPITFNYESTVADEQVDIIPAIAPHLADAEKKLLTSGKSEHSLLEDIEKLDKSEVFFVRTGKVGKAGHYQLLYFDEASNGWRMYSSETNNYLLTKDGALTEDGINSIVAKHATWGQLEGNYAISMLKLSPINLMRAANYVYDMRTLPLDEQEQALAHSFDSDEAIRRRFEQRFTLDDRLDAAPLEHDAILTSAPASSSSASHSSSFEEIARPADMSDAAFEIYSRLRLTNQGEDLSDIDVSQTTPNERRYKFPDGTSIAKLIARKHITLIPDLIKFNSLQAREQRPELGGGSSSSASHSSSSKEIVKPAEMSEVAFNLYQLLDLLSNGEVTAQQLAESTTYDERVQPIVGGSSIASLIREKHPILIPVLEGLDNTHLEAMQAVEHDASTSPATAVQASSSSTATTPYKDRINEYTAKLSANILNHENGRKSSHNSRSKADRLRGVAARYNLKESPLSTQEFRQALREIKQEVGRKRNKAHFWQKPHSVSEFNSMLSDEDKAIMSSSDDMRPSPRT
jgi:hypothetical protein